MKPLATRTPTRGRTKSQNPRKYFSLETNGTTADIVIYGDITSWPWLESDVSAYNLSKQIEALDVDVINVGINSYGGEVSEGLAIYNALRRHRAKVRTRCDGFACSAASVVFAAGDERVMSDASLLMIHNAWVSATGNAEDLRKQADDLEKINDASVTAYMAVVSIEEEELRALMDGETWLSPEEAVEIGLATSIESEESDRPSQSVRRSVMQKMLVNPYQVGEDPDEEPDPQDPEPDPDPEPEPEPDDPEPDPDKDETASQMARLFQAISHM